MQNFNLYIRKRTFPEWMALWLIILPLIYGFLFSFLQLPSIIKYTADVAWITLLLTMLLNRSIILYKRTVPILITVIAFAIYTFVVYMLNFQSLFYYLWGIRNNFRYYVFFFALTVYFSEDDAISVFKVFDVLFWINAVISLIQYFFLGYERDRLGGIFGVEVGANAYTIVFFIIVISKSLLCYMSKKESSLSCFSKCALSLFVAALAELKFYFVIFLLILFFSAILTAFSWRKLIIIMLGAVVAMFGSLLLTALFDFENVLSFDFVWKLATQEYYSAEGTVNRLSAIPVLAKKILTEWYERVFGLGLGNCDTSAFAICNTPFYQTYGQMRYTWFSCAFLFLETGYIGLVLYITVFVLCFFLARRQLKSGMGNPIFCQMAMIMSVICVALTFYNSSLRIEVGYLVYFILALPFLQHKVYEKGTNEWA